MHTKRSIIKEDPKSSFDCFFQIIKDAGDVAFPEIEVKPKTFNSFRSPWMSKGLFISSKTKNKLFSKKIKVPSEVNINNFKQFNILFNKCKKAAKKSYYSTQFNIYKDNIKQTWTLIRDVIGSQSKTRENLPNFFRQNKDILNNAKDIADGFNDFFAGIGPQLAAEIDQSGRSFKSYLNNCDSLFRISLVTETSILNVIKKLKPKTSSGVDCVSNKLLKRIAPIIINPLHYLINLSLESGFVPQQMKVSKIILL